MITTLKELTEARRHIPGIIILTSIGGSPITNGHTRLITNCKKEINKKFAFSSWCPLNLKLIVLVNSNNFLLKKHGYVFQDEQERAEIIDSIKDVDYTFIYDTPSTIEGAIKELKPHFLCKGGDRTPETMAQVEIDSCLGVGCEIVYGVGGGKIQSSSELLKKWRKNSEFI